MVISLISLIRTGDLVKWDWKQPTGIKPVRIPHNEAAASAQFAEGSGVSVERGLSHRRSAFGLSEARSIRRFEGVLVYGCLENLSQSAKPRAELLRGLPSCARCGS